MKTYKSLKNEIYDIIYPQTKYRFKDDDWTGIKNVFEIISLYVDKFNAVNGTDFSFDWYVENGGYRESRDGFSKWKEYRMKIVDNIRNKEYYGLASCCACGTIENPFLYYDICLIFE